MRAGALFVACLVVWVREPHQRAAVLAVALSAGMLALWELKP